MVEGFARLGRAALPARGPRHRRPGPGGRPHARRDRRLAAGAGRSPSRRRRRWRPGRRRRRPRERAGSGGEQQVEPAHGEGHHREQQRQLAGQLVPLRQHLDRPVVGRDHADHVPEHDREHLDRRQQRRVVGEPVVDAPVGGAEQVAAVAERVAGLDQGLLARPRRGRSGSARRCSPTMIGTTECANRFGRSRRGAVVGPTPVSIAADRERPAPTATQNASSAEVVEQRSAGTSVPWTNCTQRRGVLERVERRAAEQHRDHRHQARRGPGPCRGWPAGCAPRSTPPRAAPHRELARPGVE